MTSTGECGRVTDSTQAAHTSAIVDQFTKQADAFAEKHCSHDTALRLLLETSGVTDQDTVLDVACGPGLVACAFAQVAQHVTGVDITPAMIDRAKRLQAEKGLHNLTWDIANVEALPYDDAAFSLVVSRYTFHHFINPRAVLAEMKRVCTPGGKVVVIDVAPDADQVDAYNHVERLRDPSHARAMPAAELLGLMRDAGLTNLKTQAYAWEVELEKQLASSFPNPGDADTLRQMFVDDLTANRLGMGTHKRGDQIYIAYPTLIIVGEHAPYPVS